MNLDHVKVQTISTRFKSQRMNNSTVLGALLDTGATFVAAKAAGVIGLHSLGFGAGGVAVGSLAASVQSGIAVANGIGVVSGQRWKVDHGPDWSPSFRFIFCACPISGDGFDSHASWCNDYRKCTHSQMDEPVVNHNL